MHLKQKIMVMDECQAERHDRKYSQWRKGPKRHKWFKKYCKITIVDKDYGKTITVIGKPYS